MLWDTTCFPETHNLARVFETDYDQNGSGVEWVGRSTNLRPVPAQSDVPSVIVDIPILGPTRPPQ